MKTKHKRTFWERHYDKHWKWIEVESAIGPTPKGLAFSIVFWLIVGSITFGIQSLLPMDFGNIWLGFVLGLLFVWMVVVMFDKPEKQKKYMR